MALLSRIPRTTWIVLAVLLAVVGIGFANYFLRLSSSADETVASVVRAEIEQPPTLALVPTQVMELSFDERSTEEANRSGIARSLEALFIGHDRLYIVDHPEWHVGSRVRWFTREGRYEGQYLAPAGSTLFTASPDGFAYVLAKTDGSSESVVLVNAEGSLESTLAVPLNINSGGLAFMDGEVYVEAQAGMTDLEAGTVDSGPVLVPVTVGGRQATDAEASDSVLEYWARTEDGETYAQSFHSEGLSSSASVAQSVTRGSDGVKLEIPVSAVCLGVTDAGELVLGLPPVSIEGGGRPLPGSVVGEEPYSEIVIVGFDGTTRSLSVVPTRSPVYPVRYCAVDGNGFWTMSYVGGTVRVTHYEEAGR